MRFNHHEIEFSKNKTAFSLKSLFLYALTFDIISNDTYL